MLLGKGQVEETIILAHNSAVFSTQMMMYLICQNEVRNHTLIITDFWLNKVDNSRLDTAWGQIKNEFPLFVQNKIELLFPSHPNGERISFRMFKMVRDAIITDLQKQNINIVFGNIEKIETTADGAAVFKDEYNEIIYTTKSKKPIIYNTLQVSRKNREITMPNGQELLPQTELYRFSKSTTPKHIIIFGNGLSAVWVKEQCPESSIRYIVKPGSTMPEAISRNSKTLILPTEIVENDPSCIQIVSVKRLIGPLINEAADFFAKNAIPEAHQINYFAILKDGKIIFVGIAYNAIGYDLKSIVSSHPVISIPVVRNESYSPKNLPIGALLDRVTHQLFKMNENVKLSSEDRMLMVQFENLFFRITDEKIFGEYMKTNGIEMPAEFFKKLAEDVQKLEDTPETPVGSIDFVVGVFAKINKKNEDIAKFKAELLKILEKKKSVFQLKFSVSSSFASSSSGTNLSLQLPPTAAAIAVSVLFPNAAATAAVPNTSLTEQLLVQTDALTIALSGNSQQTVTNVPFSFKPLMLAYEDSKKRNALLPTADNDPINTKKHEDDLAGTAAAPKPQSAIVPSSANRIAAASAGGSVIVALPATVGYSKAEDPVIAASMNSSAN